MNFKIESVKSFQVLNSRGLPCLETTVKIKGLTPIAVKSPQGASCGFNEPKDLIDHDFKNWSGFSLNNARKRVKHFEKLLVGKSFSSPLEFDTYLLAHGLMPKKEVNISVGLSFSFALSYLRYKTTGFEQVFPQVMLNFINGGAHANSGLDIQEIMIVPKSRSPLSSLKLGQEVFTALKNSFLQKGYSTSVGDEGGFIWPTNDPYQALAHLDHLCDELGYRKHQDYELALDCAANNYYKRETKQYIIAGELKTGYEYQRWLSHFIETFKIKYVEDPFDETDHQGYQEFLQKKPKNLVVISDDLTVSQQKPIEAALSLGQFGGVIFKPNQNGLFSTFTKAIQYAKSSSLLTILSHRSGDTEDSWLTDLALFFSVDFLKAGALSRSERLAKYNQLLKREQELEHV